MSKRLDDWRRAERNLLRRPPWLLGSIVAVWLAWVSWRLTWMSAIYHQAWKPFSSTGATAWYSLMTIVAVLWLLLWRGRSIEKIGPVLVTGHFLVVAIIIVADRGPLPLMLGLILVGLAVYLPIGLSLRMRPDGRKATNTLLHMICAAVVVPALLLIIWSPANASIIAFRASTIARDAPFCLQRPWRILEQKEVSRWSELSGFNLQAPWTAGTGSDEFQHGFHAVLVVERNGRPQFYNWSYYRQTFLPISERSVRALHVRQSCNPSLVFFDEMQL